MNNHYHCPECGKVLTEVFRLNWIPEDGVRIVYSDGLHLYIKKDLIEDDLMELKIK